MKESNSRTGPNTNVCLSLREWNQLLGDPPPGTPLHRVPSQWRRENPRNSERNEVTLGIYWAYMYFPCFRASTQPLSSHFSHPLSILRVLHLIKKINDNYFRTTITCLLKIQDFNDNHSPLHHGNNILKMFSSFCLSEHLISIRFGRMDTRVFLHSHPPQWHGFQLRKLPEIETAFNIFTRLLYFPGLGESGEENV